MSDFLFLLGFSAIPLMTALAYAALTPAMGAALYLRGEILLGIVLPPFGSAVIGLCVLGGLSAENRLLMGLIVAASLFAFLSAPVFRNAHDNGSDRKKEIALAAVFVLGQTVTYLAMHFSTNVHADLSHLLSGEILAVGPVELWTALAMNAALLGLCYRFRGFLYEYCLDETGLRIRHRSHRRIETGVPNRRIGGDHFGAGLLRAAAHHGLADPAAPVRHAGGVRHRTVFPDRRCHRHCRDPHRLHLRAGARLSAGVYHLRGPLSAGRRNPGLCENWSERRPVHAILNEVLQTN